MVLSVLQKQMKGLSDINIVDISVTAPQTEVILLAAYCRVSSDSDDQLHSFAAQIRYYKDYERNHPLYKLVDIYADEGITGTCVDKRDEFSRMISDCKKGKINRIIVKSVSRFARNTEELLITLRLLKDLNVSVYFEEQDIDTEKLNMEMIVTFPGMAAQQESEAISGNMRWSYKKRMESGEFNCCRPAYGYSLCNGKITINEEEANVVRRIFSLFLNGMGKQRIANLLNSEGVPNRYYNHKWYASTIRYILTNERYIGDSLLQKKYTTDHLPYKKMRNHGERAQYYVENSHSPIVSKETFHAAQDLIKMKGQNHSSHNRYLLSGIMRCAFCGKTYRRQIIRNKAYWTCSYRSSGFASCDNFLLREDQIYDAYMLMLDKLITYKKVLIDSTINQFKELKSKSGDSCSKIRNIDKQIADLSARHLVITRLHTGGVLNAADFAAQASEVDNKLKSLRFKRRELLNENDNEMYLDELYELSDILTEYGETQGYTTHIDEDLFNNIVTEITVYKSEITFKLLGGIEFTEMIMLERQETAS